MASLPIELLPTNHEVSALVEGAAEIANSVQSEFVFAKCDDAEISTWWALSSQSQVVTTEAFDEISLRRERSRGYHPFLMMFTVAILSGKNLSNLFGSHRAERGLAVVTMHQVSDLLGSDVDAKTGYILYYLARYSMSFIAPSVQNHDESRQCIYDRKINKSEIIESMRSGAICDRCRVAIWDSGKGTHAQMDAVNRMLDHASSLIHKTRLRKRPNVFIGSSSKHLEYARVFKSLLGPEFAAQVWDEDSVFRLGTATIEQLEQHVAYYDFGVFFMLPDDRVQRGSTFAMTPRDNVVFEAGLFTGRLSRKRTIIITTLSRQVTLPSDLLGLTTVQIDYDRLPEDTLTTAARRAAEHMKRVFGEGA